MAVLPTRPGTPPRTSWRQAAGTVGLVIVCGSAFSAPAFAGETPRALVDAAALPSGSASHDVRKLAGWVLGSGDHQGMPFLLVDKVDAKVFAFDSEGRLLGVTAALMGLGEGDISPQGVGDRKLSSISPVERVTPAGRFIASLGENLGGKDILWVDYAAAISLHRVDTAKPRERRLQRLATPSPSDNRISYGCINVPVAFYETVIGPLFRGRVGVVYILPELRGVEEVFFPTTVLSQASPQR